VILIHTSRLHFIHTNDLHSQFKHWPQTVSLIRSIIRKCKDKNEPYILLDIGDHMDRSHYITEGSSGQANIELMNQVGYHFATIGNNEGITFSKEHLNHMYLNAKFKLIVNNLLDCDGSKPRWLAPYVIHECGSRKIGIIGATANFELFYQILGWKIEDPMERIAEQVAFLRDQVDLLVIMSHLGLQRDEQLAQNIAGIDLILGAHTHHLLQDGLQVEQCLINQAGRSGEYVGHVTVEWNGNSGYNMFSTCSNVKEEAPDPEALELLSAWGDKARKSLSEKVVLLEQGIETSWYEESISGNLLAEGLKEWCKTPIAFVNSGQILEDLPSGYVTKEDLHRICPHPINPCVVKLKGKDIWSILQRSLDKELQQLKIKGLGFRGEVMGMFSIEGIEVYYKQSGLPKKEIIMIKQGEELLQGEKIYNVATIDMLTFSRIFPELYKPKEVQYLMPEFIRDVLAYRLENGDLSRAYEKRWKKVENVGGDSYEVY
jgi:5'-nucleotidase